MKFDLILIIDIAVTILVSYKFFSLIKETRAIQLLNGVLILLLIALTSNLLGLKTFNYLLEQIKTVVLIGITVAFQPELRRALEKIGKDSLFSYLAKEENFHTSIDKLVAAVIRLSQDKVGALIVIKRSTGLRDIIDTGVEINGVLSTELLMNIFTPNSPLHDGAVIIEGDRIVAANCLLPLSQNQRLKQSMGTRHRAGIGMSEDSDALVLIVSEETGVISTAYEGKIKYNLDEFLLKERLFNKFEDIDVK